MFESFYQEEYGQSIHLDGCSIDINISAFFFVRAAQSLNCL
jgi:hypothetical protein